MKVLLIILFQFSILTLYCQEQLAFILDFSPRIWGKIFEDRLSIEYYTPDTSEIEDILSLPITQSKISGLLYITFTIDEDLFPEPIQLIKPVLAGNKHWLIINNKTENYVTIHEEDNREPLYRYSLKYTERPSSVSFTATSHLTENGIEYGPENLKDIRTGRPWVEGVPGDGVGEKIFLTYDRYPNEGFSHLLLSNGFVSYRNPSLYGKNGRLKRIRVEDRESDFSQVFEIEDTPNYQILGLEKSLKSISLEILEIYPGSLWDDTCVNLLEPVWPQL